MPGSQVDIAGTKNRMINSKRPIPKYGMDALKHSSQRDVRRRQRLHRVHVQPERRRDRGPNCTLSREIVANHNMSKPNSLTIGKKIGSRDHHDTGRVHEAAKDEQDYLGERDDDQWGDIQTGSPIHQRGDRARAGQERPKLIEPTTMKKTMTVTRVVLLAALKIIFQLNCLYKTATKTQATTPSAALSLGGSQTEEHAPHHGEKDDAHRRQVRVTPTFHFSRREILATS